MVDCVCRCRAQMGVNGGALPEYGTREGAVSHLAMAGRATAGLQHDGDTRPDAAQGAVREAGRVAVVAAAARLESRGLEFTSRRSMYGSQDALASGSVPQLARPIRATDDCAAPFAPSSDSHDFLPTAGPPHPLGPGLVVGTGALAHAATPRITTAVAEEARVDGRCAQRDPEGSLASSSHGAAARGASSAGEASAQPPQVRSVHVAATVHAISTWDAPTPTPAEPPRPGEPGTEPTPTMGESEASGYQRGFLVGFDAGADAQKRECREADARGVPVQMARFPAPPPVAPPIGTAEDVRGFRRGFFAGFMAGRGVQADLHSAGCRAEWAERGPEVEEF